MEKPRVQIIPTDDSTFENLRTLIKEGNATHPIKTASSIPYNVSMRMGGRLEDPSKFLALRLYKALVMRRGKER